MRLVGVSCLGLAVVSGVVAGCDTGAVGGGGGPDPNKPGLAISMAPADAVMKATFDLYVRINDMQGNPVTGDNTTDVTVKLSAGSGALTGTLTRKAMSGMVRFDDLKHDSWETIRLTVSAMGFKDATTASFPVRPIMRFKEPPSFRVRTGTPIGPTTLELVDGEGMPVTSKADQKVTLTTMPAGATIAGGADRTFTNGVVTYEMVSFGAVGASTMIWTSSGLGTLMQGVIVYDMLKTDTRWMPAGRVGIEYNQEVVQFGGQATYQLISGKLQPGLTFNAADGRITGKPTAAGHRRLEVVTTDSANVFTLWLTDLSVFPAVEPVASTLDGADVAGPHTFGTIDDTVNVMSRGKTEAIRIFFPSEGGGNTVKPGKWPLVVFHHGAANTNSTYTATIYDRYDPLLQRWATHGFIVVTIDGLDLIFSGSPRMGTFNTYANLSEMSQNQRATIALMKTKNDDSASPFFKHVDVDRVITAGHSRGGAASLITSREDPSVMAAILLKPIDPVMSQGGEAMWNGMLPGKPYLLNIASADNDVIYPICDFLYDRRTSVMAAHSIIGTVHNYTKELSGGLCPPEPNARPAPGFMREQDWAITNAYATAFLRYVANGDLTYAPLLFDRPALSTGLSPQGVLTRGDRKSSPVMIDDFQDKDPATNSLGQPTTSTGFSESIYEPSLKTAITKLPAGSPLRTFYNKSLYMDYTAGHKLTWTAAGASYKSDLGSIDVTGRGAFVFRGRADAANLDKASFSVKFTDAAGGSAMLAGNEYIGNNGFQSNFFSDVVVPVGEIKGSGADITKLSAVEIIMNAASGTLFIDDIRFE